MCVFSIFFIKHYFYFYKYIYKNKNVFTKNDPYVFKYEISDKLYKNPFLLHLYYYLFLNPQLKAYNIFYMTAKSLFFKKNYFF